MHTTMTSRIRRDGACGERAGARRPQLAAGRLARHVAALALIAAGVASMSVLGAQQPDRSGALVAQIDRIFKAHEFDPPRFGPARWLPDGTAYAIVERAEGGGTEIVEYAAAGGARSVLVPAGKLTPPGAKSALDIDDYEWSADGKRLLIFTNTKKVWRRNTRGDYWVLDV